MRLPSRPLAVEEFHGPYGPYHVSELVLQRIWLERAFDEARLKDQWGREIVIEHPGKWNRLDGPDFRDATLLIGGERVIGDVEVHFSQSEWVDHGHQRDPAYNRVILHVVYHPSEPGARQVLRQDGEALPRVALLPLLWYSLEEYACEDSIIASTGVDMSPEVEGLIGLQRDSRRRVLRERAARRWELKRFFAGKRIERLGWEAACHQSALEILGYSKNRLPMLRVAERFPLLSLLDGSIDEGALWDAGADRWRLSGCRPANHPRRRLAQYLAWIQERPCWPELLRELGKQLSGRRFVLENGAEFGSLEARRALEIAQLRRHFDERIVAGQVGGKKLDTLICDGILPLLSRQGSVDWFEVWFHWFAGNAPAACSQGLRQAEVVASRRVPMCNGWIQGMLGSHVSE